MDNRHNLFLYFNVRGSIGLCKMTIMREIHSLYRVAKHTTDLSVLCPVCYQMSYEPLTTLRKTLRNASLFYSPITSHILTPSTHLRILQSGKSLYRGKAMVPYVQFTTNCGLGYSSSKKYFFITEIAYSTVG